VDFYEQMLRKSYANERRRYDAFELGVCFAFPCDKTLSPYKLRIREGMKLFSSEGSLVTYTMASLKCHK